MTNFSVVKGNIVNMKVDAIVNAANTSLLGGEGVDGAIHAAAGTELLSCCRRIGGCKTGDAVITPGFKLDAKYIIHTVGPVWNNGLTNEAELLRQCYIKSLDLAVEYNCKTVAFPSISTGAYRYPLAKAAELAINTILEYLEQDTCLEDVKLVCFDSRSPPLPPGHPRGCPLGTQQSQSYPHVAPAALEPKGTFLQVMTGRGPCPTPHEPQSPGVPFSR